MIPCPSCGANNSDKRTACYQCGKPLAAAAPAPNGTNVGGRLLEIEPGGAPTTPQTRPAPPRTGRQAAWPPPQPQPDEMTPARAAALSGRMFYGGRGQVKRGAVFFRELSDLLASGMGMVEALSHLESKVGLASRAAVRDMQAQVKDGKALSTAMAAHPEAFLSYQIGLIQAAELSGALPAVLARIAEHLEADYRLRLEVAQQTFLFKIFHIPGILIALPLLLMLLFDRLESLPQVLALYAHYFTYVTLPVSLGLLALWLGWPLIFGMAWVQRLLEVVARPLPVMGRLQRLATMSRFLGMLSALWGGGLPPGQALEAAAVAGGSRRLAEQVFRVSPDLQTGGNLVSVLERIRVLDDELLGHLRVGEVSGNLPEALDRLARRYQEEYENYCRLLPKLAYATGLAILLPVMAGMIIYFFKAGYLRYALEEPMKMVDDAFQGH